MSEPCPLCGAQYPDDETCRQRFERCLALEFEDAIAATVHHLTVSCYMLQHNAYSRETWLAARKMLAQFIEEDVSPAEMRKQIASQVDNARRANPLTRGEKLAEFDQICWSSSLAQVHLDDPERYCREIRLWAESILHDTAPLIQRLKV